MAIAGSVLGKSKDSKVRKSIASAKVACSKSALKGDAGCHVSCKSKVSFSLNQVLGFSLSLVLMSQNMPKPKHLVFRFWKCTRCQPYNPTTRQSGGSRIGDEMCTWTAATAAMAATGWKWSWTSWDQAGHHVVLQLSYYNYSDYSQSMRYENIWESWCIGEYWWHLRWHLGTFCSQTLHTFKKNRLDWWPVSGSPAKLPKPWTSLCRCTVGIDAGWWHV